MVAEDEVVVTELKGPPADISNERSKPAKKWDDRKPGHHQKENVPVDWDDDAKPKPRKPKPGQGGNKSKFKSKSKSKSESKPRPEGVVESFKKKTGKSGGFGKPTTGNKPGGFGNPKSGKPTLKSTGAPVSKAGKPKLRSGKAAFTGGKSN